MKKALLALADGTVFEGRALGYEGETVGEVVFNTAMTGYQEVLTDPSYKGQIITMTCPHIGNYGVTPEDMESRRSWAEGFVVLEASRLVSNWRSQQTIQEMLTEAKVVAIEGIDTRALTRHLREHGSQQGIITHLDSDRTRAVGRAKQAPSIIGRDLATEVTCARSYEWTTGSGDWIPATAIEGPVDERPTRWRVVAYDFGIKHNILRRLVDVGCHVTVVPAATSAAEVAALRPDGVFLSNGPGDPEGVPYAVKAVEDLIGRFPIFGICLGHQILCLAFGLKTYKLKFGHHGANHPVMDLRTRKVEITSQNHNFAVQGPGPIREVPKAPPVVETRYGSLSLTHISLNDYSIEGMVCMDHPVFSVQYHPEAAPGPHDASYLFDEFVRLMEKQHA
ncbi:MAG: glutamine-hydrolyzing carbamoyl-phosphate synthase small subunit [Nitrospira sp.]|nr:glutamine-hydrolyzing carbamoyl-phosphate synthase small subunit [Nitrospira sp.]MDH4244477.1 glutamine-hydrolyzing carbamoyl-phosphate synthase small subunit [Nitrospira sp.]MDH4356066.1 glutamine-hydrolyzing carbamoyl-phosphate synthase small subunit [Nitrospira sp.]MDH5319092.1 glutamine-hydrolyzing carbamoyl-phosphate synthase small subunit [Nitrospira sp.]